MITPFEVYLVMQLDTILNGLIRINILLGIALIAFSIAGMAHSPGEHARAENKPSMDALASKYFLFARKAAIALVLAITINSLLPSSKTAAAMIILPALTSKEVTEPLAAEGKELYALAKQALRDAVDAKPEPKPETK